MLGQTLSPGMGEPGMQHLGSHMCCDLIGGQPLLLWGCRVFCSSKLGSETLRGCRMRHSSIAPHQNAAEMPGCETFCGSFPRQDVSEKVCMKGRKNIFTIFQTSPWKSWESCQGMMAFLHHHSVAKPILLGIGVCQQLSLWCSGVTVPAMARRGLGWLSEHNCSLMKDF